MMKRSVVRVGLCVVAIAAALLPGKAYAQM